LATLFVELVDGPPAKESYMLNRGDVGLLRSLDKLTAGDASRTSGGGASIAAHVDHVRYGLSLMNRWAQGEKPFESADWTASWKKTTVSDAEWQQLGAALGAEAHRWLEAAIACCARFSTSRRPGVANAVACRRAEVPRVTA
jgi:hypothetical protein